MKVTDKGQVTIPIGIRRKAGLLPNTDVEFVMSKDIAPCRTSSSAPMRPWNK